MAYTTDSIQFSSGATGGFNWTSVTSTSTGLTWNPNSSSSTWTSNLTCTFSHEVLEWTEVEAAMRGYCSACGALITAPLPENIEVERLKALVELMLEGDCRAALQLADAEEAIEREYQAILTARALIATARKIGKCKD